MGLGISRSFKALPASVRANLTDCITEETFDQIRFDAIVNEHHVGLRARERKRLLDAAYLEYVKEHPEVETEQQ